MLRKALQRTHRGSQYVEHTDGDGGEMLRRFVKLGLKERRANRRACSELKHDGYRLQIHVRDGATFTARQQP